MKLTVRKPVIHAAVRKSLYLVCLFSILLFATNGLAAHPLITDDTGTQGKGKFQIEFNGEYGHDKENGVTMKTTQAATTLSYGVTDPVDIVLVIPYHHIRTKDSESATKGDGISDISIELKWRFYEKEGLSFALKPGFSLPTGDDEKGLGSGKVTCQLFFIATKELKPWDFHVNLGYIRNENKRDERKNLWHASLATTVEITKDLKAVANIGIEKNADRNLNIHPAFILGGLIYSPSENFDIDLGIKGGLTRPETDYAVLAGITWRF